LELVTAKPEKLTPVEQEAKAAPSRLHWKLTPGCASVKVKVALSASPTEAGAEVMTGAGGPTEFTVQL